MYTKIVIISTCLVVALAQDCRTYGKKCMDHQQCCGGCCIDGICIDTYRSCITPFDVCHNHICMGEESCIVYVPPECPGCEPVPLCRIL